MKKICVKCGHVNTRKSFDSLSECPRCGAIYAKAEAAEEERIQQEEQGQAESPSSGGRNVLTFLVLGGLACLIFYYYWGNGPARKHGKQAEKPVVEQKNRPATRVVHRRPLPGRVNLARKEREAEETGVQESEVSDSRESPATAPATAPATVTTVKKTAPTTIVTVTKTVSYYLAESTISQGERVDLRAHLSKGRYTVFYFYAEW